MVKQKTPSWDRFIIILAFIALAALIWLLVMREFRLDDSFITYRYARNLASGLGLVYNAGDSVLSTTAPLYAMLLAALSFIFPDFHLLGSLIGILAIGLGGALVYGLLSRHLPQRLAAWGGVIYTLSSPLWLSLGMETALWIMLVLAAVWLVDREDWRLAGLMIGLAVLVRPDAALPGLLIGLTALGATIHRINTRRQWWLPLVGYGALAALPIILFALWAMATYGSPFPVTLSAKSAQAVLGITGMGYDVTYWEGLRLILRSLMEQSPLYVSLALLALFGLAGRIPSSTRLIVAWGGLHLVAYILLGVAPYRWYYVPLVPGAVMLAAHGIHYLDERLRQRNIAYGRYILGIIAVFPILGQMTSFTHITDMMRDGGVVDVMLPIVDWDAYRQTGEWLAQSTPDDATVGVAEVGQIGFYAERWMTDYLGLLQPEVAAALKRGDLYSWLAGYAPDYLPFQRFRGAALVLYNYVIQDDPWFNANYQPAAEFDDPRYAAGPVTIFERVTPVHDFVPQAVDLTYGDLRLVGMATDSPEMDTDGRPVRVKLDWQVIGEGLPENLHIAVKVVDQVTNPGFDGDYPTANWSGSFATYHGFVVPEGIQPGRYPILVAVGPQGGPYHEQNAGWIEVR